MKKLNILKVMKSFEIIRVIFMCSLFYSNRLKGEIVNSSKIEKM